jgi:hypothetical protein
MFRHIYLAAMGAGIGAVAAASCGHPPLWVGVGIALGLIWARLAPEPIRTIRPDHRQAALRARSTISESSCWVERALSLCLKRHLCRRADALICRRCLRSWLNQLVALRRVTFVIGVA